MAAVQFEGRARTLKTEVSDLSDRPNILLVVSDDQPLGSMGVMPQTKEWLKRRGTKYTNAYATTPVCCPSRASILTGQYSHNHRVLRNGSANELDSTAVVHRLLQNNGYLTGAFGKFLNSWDVDVPPPYFDEWAVVPRAKYAYWGGNWSIDGKIRRIQQYGTSFVERTASRFIEDAELDDERPWFAYLAPPAPHPPFHAEKQYEDEEFSWAGVPSNFEIVPSSEDPDARADKPPYVQEGTQDLSDGEGFRERQFRTLLSLDDMMGKLHETLVSTGESRDTLIIYISDNGFLWGQHGISGKFVPYLEAVRVPALISWPKGFEVARRDDRLVANIDVAPTILDASGVEPDAGFAPDGRSLLDTSWERERLLIEAWRERDNVPTWAGFVSTEDSYIEYYDPDNVITFREYYELVTDPYQLRNLFGDSDPFNDPPDSLQMMEDLIGARTCAGPTDCP